MTKVKKQTKQTKEESVREKKSAKDSEQSTAKKTTKATQKGADFVPTMQAGYSVSGDSILLGAAMHDKGVEKDAKVQIAMKTLNRHGLIAGATGTGKTKSLQLLAGELSKQGVPSLLMDFKGDLSGIAKAAQAGTPNEKRQQALGLPFQPSPHPVEFLTLSNEPGLRLRATVSEFGPILLGKILEFNDTQTGILGVIFQFCDDNGYLLLDLEDLKKVFAYAQAEGKEEVAKKYGQISPASLGTMLRKIVTLEQQGAGSFFGERSFEVTDLVRTNSNGQGLVSIIRLLDIQNKPALFSTLMLQLLAEVFEKLPEVGDLPKPKLVIFIDEAHLVFSTASKALLEQIENIIKLIRSKGVGVIFCTQNPDDVPASVLSQLGLKIQHALRAFTARDRKAIEKASENFPESKYYDTSDLLSALGIGEALVSGLDEKGRPTPLAHTMMCAPDSRMDILTESEIQGIVKGSSLADKYAEKINRESAYEMLSKKVEALAKATEEEKAESKKPTKPKKEEKSTVEKVIGSPVVKEIGRTVAREVTRGVLGVFGIGGRGKGKKSSWF